MQTITDCQRVLALSVTLAALASLKASAREAPTDTRPPQLAQSDAERVELRNRRIESFLAERQFNRQPIPTGSYEGAFSQWTKMPQSITRGKPAARMPLPLVNPVSGVNGTVWVPVINCKHLSQTVGFNVNTCDFNPNIKVQF